MNSIASRFIEVTQTGQLSNTTNLIVNAVQLTPPDPVTVDLTAGNRATNETGLCLYFSYVKLYLFTVFSTSHTSKEERKQYTSCKMHEYCE